MTWTLARTCEQVCVGVDSDCEVPLSVHFPLSCRSDMLAAPVLYLRLWLGCPTHSRRQDIPGISVLHDQALGPITLAPAVLHAAHSVLF